MATATVSTLRVGAPRLCLVSFAHRVYDTTDFVDRHPGGADLMQRYHGKDATKVFDAFPHSPMAHDLMRDQMLRFDAIAHVGRYGAPSYARTVLPRPWSALRDVEDACKASAASVTASTAQALSEISRQGHMLPLMLAIATIPVVMACM